MVEIQLDKETGAITIGNYNGNFGTKEVFHLKGISYPTKLNFFRQGSNHAYINGVISCKGDCKNNLVISPYRNHKVLDVRNAFIFVGNSFVEVSPIFDVWGAINRGKRTLAGTTVVYHIPGSVYERENLDEKSVKHIRKAVREGYGVEGDIIYPIHSRHRRGGIYYLESKKKERYVFRYKGKAQERAELLSVIANENLAFFPKANPRTDGVGHIIEMERGFYGLDSFVEGETRQRDASYFLSLGEFMQRLHQHLDVYSQKCKGLEQILSSEDLFLNESSIASVYLDLAINGEGHFCLLSQLEDILLSDLVSRIKRFPKQLIHRDLNQSNILWTNEGARVIELESLGFSARINEFIPALLLEGDRKTPKYLGGSLSILINSYNPFSVDPLSESELDILPSLLRYNLIRYYAIRTIRRKIGGNSELEKLQKDLNQIKQETL